MGARHSSGWTFPRVAAEWFLSSRIPGQCDRECRLQLRGQYRTLTGFPKHLLPLCLKNAGSGSPNAARRYVNPDWLAAVSPFSSMQSLGLCPVTLPEYQGEIPPSGDRSYAWAILLVRKCSSRLVVNVQAPCCTVSNERLE